MNHNVLKLKLIKGHQDILEFFDENGLLISHPIFMHLHKYSNQALHDPSLWKNDELRDLYMLRFRNSYFATQDENDSFYGTTSMVWL